jgi:hypothetical protein
MANEPLPAPYDEIRQLHRDYGRLHDEIWTDPSRSEQEKKWDSGGLWVRTDERLKQLRRGLPKKRRCTATTKDGKPCTKWANPDFIGQKCSSHMPHVSEW